MSLVGNLEDLPLADILQIVSLSKRTGILTIETQEGKNVIVFKDGLIISAACPSPKIKNLGQVLLERQLVTPSRLQELLDLLKCDVVEIPFEPANAPDISSQPRPADFFVYLIDQLTILHHIKKSCISATVNPNYRITNEVIGNAGQLHNNDP